MRIQVAGARAGSIGKVRVWVVASRFGTVRGSFIRTGIDAGSTAPTPHAPVPTEQPRQRGLVSLLLRFKAPTLRRSGPHAPLGPSAAMAGLERVRFWLTTSGR